MKTKWIVLLISIFSIISASALERVPVWPKGKMPNAQSHQIAAMTDEAGKKEMEPIVSTAEAAEKQQKAANNQSSVATQEPSKEPAKEPSKKSKSSKTK